MNSEGREQEEEERQKQKKIVQEEEGGGGGEKPASSYTAVQQSQMHGNNYPLSESFKVLEGYDIFRSPNFIVALVAVESQFGRDLRLYRWQNRKGQWKVDLCRMSVASWQWDTVAAKAKELVQKYDIGRKKRTSPKGMEEKEL